MIKLRTILHCDLFYLICFFIPLIFIFVPSDFKIEEYYKVIDIEDGKVILKSKYKVLGYFNDDVRLHLNDKVKVSYKIIEQDNVTVANTFSYKNYLKSQGIDAVVNILSIEVVCSNNNIIYTLKEKFKEYVYSFDNDYLIAFVLGDSSKISFAKAYQELGVISIFSVSGVHLGLLVTIFNSKKRFSFSFCFVLLIYLFITDFCVSLTRSVIYFILTLLKKKLSLNIKNENILLLVGSLMLFLNPYRILSIGFQYSFFLSYMILKKKTFLKGKGSIFFSFFCFLCSFVITWSHFYEVNVLSFVYQLIFTPIGLVLFIGSFIVLVFPWLLVLYNKLIFILEFFTSILLKIKFDTIILGKPHIFVIFFFILILLMSNNKKHLLFLLILLISHLFLVYQLKYFYEALDVGQGDSNIIYVNRQCILIDTGGFNMTNDNKNKYFLSNNKIITHLKSYGIRKIDYLILTHGDYDHMGEAINLVENFTVEKVIFNCGEFNDLEKDLIEVLDKKKIQYYSCIKELNIDDNKLYFLNNNDYCNENDNSSVIYTELSNHKFLFMGDAGVEVEEDLIEKYNLQDIDVLKVGHHGSKTSSSKNFIDEIKPKYSIISVGKNNRYGHPNNSVLENLNNSKIYRTDQDGSIKFEIKNNKLEIATCSP